MAARDGAAVMMYFRGAPQAFKAMSDYREAWRKAAS
jgi:hypothetical protein